MLNNSSENRTIVVIAHDIRSAHNVGSLFRTCEGLGINKLYLTGYTPYPKLNNDDRLPHEYNKIESQIDKTALGSQQLLSWDVSKNVKELISEYRNKGFEICALEQNNDSISLSQFKVPDKVVLILGNEVTGIEDSILEIVNYILEIPMKGKKESFNVVQAAAMTLFALKYHFFDTARQ